MRLEESVGGNCNRADLDRAEKAVEEFRCVGKKKKDTFLRANTQAPQCVAYTVCLLQQMAVNNTFVAAFNCDFFSSAFGNIAVNKASGDVELLRQVKQGGEAPELPGISCASQCPRAGGIIAWGIFGCRLSVYLDLYATGSEILFVNSGLATMRT